MPTTAKSQTPNDFLMAVPPRCTSWLRIQCGCAPFPSVRVEICTMTASSNRALPRFAPDERKPGTGGTGTGRECTQRGNEQATRPARAARRHRTQAGFRHVPSICPGTEERRPCCHSFVYADSHGHRAVLDRDEYVEQAYFFRVFRERLADNLPAQDILTRVHEELLSSTRLPYAVQFLVAELKHSGLLANGFCETAALLHSVPGVRRSGRPRTRRSGFRCRRPCSSWNARRSSRPRSPTKPGLFIYQFETIARNRLGYLDGTAAVAADPIYDADWRAFIGGLPRQVGDIDFADLVYLRSELYRAGAAARESVLRAVAAAAVRREGGEDRQGEPQPRPAVSLRRAPATTRVSRSATLLRSATTARSKWEKLETKLRELETRLKLAEGELRGNVDLSQFGKPDLLKDEPE